MRYLRSLALSLCTVLAFSIIAACNGGGGPTAPPPPPTELFEGTWSGFLDARSVTGSCLAQLFQPFINEFDEPTQVVSITETGTTLEASIVTPVGLRHFTGFTNGLDFELRLRGNPTACNNVDFQGCRMRYCFGDFVYRGTLSGSILSGNFVREDPTQAPGTGATTYRGVFVWTK